MIGSHGPPRSLAGQRQRAEADRFMHQSLRARSTKEGLKMRRLTSVNSQVFAAAVLSSMLAFVADASAKDTGNVVKMCVCRGSCRLVTMCLGTYCYTETVCEDCANCRSSRVVSSARSSQGQKLCLYRKGPACVTHVTTRLRRR